MLQTLRNSKLKVEDIHYINAHATSTPTGDGVELKAIQKLYNQSEMKHKIYISSLKGHIGHLLGAAGAVESIVSIMSCKNKTLLPTLNLTEIDSAFGMGEYPNLEFVKDNSVKLENVKKLTLLKNSFGFGGTNASLCISNYV